MIAGLVEFDLSRGSKRDETLAIYRQSAEGWVTNQDLIEKYYVLDPTHGRGGGIYLWPSVEAARRNLGADYGQMIKTRYGFEPEIRLVEAVLRVEPGAGRITTL